MIRSLVMVWLAIGCLVPSAAPAAGQQDVFIPMDAGFLAFSLGWTSAENKATSKNADGASFQFTADWITMRPYISIGLSIASLNQHEETAGIRDNLNTVPAYITVKYWLGKREWRTYGYAGLCVGGYNSTVESLDQVTEDYIRDRTSGFSLGVPVGFAVFVSRRVALTASYQFGWFNGSFYDNDIAHLLLIGAGITIGIDD
ncbi:MAG: outer membrane beta-barrel protein [Candidatus Latescibacterota bacterium]|nr:MAG: outer membrane beta-barrel protein [Candidatus Latescibacterota bacterium]